MAFIVGTYNKYDSWDREHAKYVFEVNEQWYAIMEVGMEWGLPQVGFRVDQDARPQDYKVYDTYEDAMRFVHAVRSAR